jgi:hypothetical protein
VDGDPWQVPRTVYVTGFPRERVEALHAALLARGVDSPYQEWIQRMDERGPRDADAPASVRVDVADWFTVAMTHFGPTPPRWIRAAPGFTSPATWRRRSSRGRPTSCWTACRTRRMRTTCSPAWTLTGQPFVTTTATPRPGGKLLLDRNFGPYLAGNTLSGMGMWFQNLAAALLIYDLTGSTLMVGVVNFSLFIGALLLVSVTGAAADRFDRRRLLMVTQGVGALAAGALAVFTLMGVVTTGLLIASTALLAWRWRSSRRRCCRWSRCWCRARTWTPRWRSTLRRSTWPVRSARCWPRG